MAIHARKMLCSCKKSKGALLSKKFRGKKPHGTETNKEGPFSLPSTIASLKKIGLVRDSNPRSPAYRTLENPS